MPQRQLWPELAKLPGGFVLYGGTAIALRLGHRVSIDFDFFTSDNFDGIALRRSMASLTAGEVLQQERNVLTVLADRGGPVKLSFFGGIGGRLADPDPTRDGVACVASPLDLLARKIKTIHDRIQQRDFIDIDALVASDVPLAEGIAGFEALFPDTIPTMLTLKALTWFADPELRDIPDSCRRRLERAARSLVAPLPKRALLGASLVGSCTRAGLVIDSGN